MQRRSNHSSVRRSVVSISELLLKGYLHERDILPNGNVLDAVLYAAEHEWANNAAPQHDVASPTTTLETRSETDEGQCCVCMSVPSRYACVPCYHLCLCRKCARRITSCPICRTHVVFKQRIFRV